jgi:ribonucleotide reductase alpha subunit
MYARFEGDERNLTRAFEKISVYAYKNEIKLKRENYTVYVERKDSLSTIDVFVPMESDG